MSTTWPTPRPNRVRSARAVALLAGIGAVAALGVTGCRLAIDADAPSYDGAVAARSRDGAVVAPRPPGSPQGGAFDERLPSVANLDADLLSALRAAATDAAAEGVAFHLTSGWRSEAEQAQLFDEAVAEHGSAEEASRWVAPPTTSSHVSGDAVDIGHEAARDWLARHGAAFGLCRVYDNEPWHFELRPDAPDEGCPGTYADASHDPRLQ